jgi:hypothetical protein
MQNTRRYLCAAVLIACAGDSLDATAAEESAIAEDPAPPPYRASKHFTGINNVQTVVTAQRHNHPGGAYSFRIERGGKVLVICDVILAGRQIGFMLHS